MIINNVEFNDTLVTVKFNDWAEVSDWWSANPKAIRIKPNFIATGIEDYNKQNESITFPCEMKFSFPLFATPLN